MGSSPCHAEAKGRPSPGPAQTKKVWRRSCRWYLMGLSLFLMTVTTTLRITLRLSKKQSTAQVQEKSQAVVPPDLFHHITDKGPLDVPSNNRQTPVKAIALPASSSPPPPPAGRLVRPDDFIYEFRGSSWDAAPIVLEEYKLIFFTIPKVACTTFKQLFRRMMGLPDWKSQSPTLMLPHNPATNGLKYLWNYTLDEANAMMTDPSYTRAIFVREPKSRFLSAFLDKGLGNFASFVRSKCCRITKDCVEQAKTSEGFLQLIHKCSDPHWNPQKARMEDKFWKYINFVGHFERLSQDGPALVQKIGAWEMYGSKGWGKGGNASLFQSSVVADQTHATGSSSKVSQWLTPALERKIESYYQADYQFPLFDFHISNLTEDFWIKGYDNIFARGPWDGAPIVVEKYKLLFFSIPRVGALTWKQAFRRMEGLPDWNQEGGPKGLPHDPDHNDLKYLYDYHPNDAERMIKDPTWTKAIFIRNPKDRFLNVFMHMKQHPTELQQQCCSRKGGCQKQGETLTQFLDLSMRCKSDQWEPQSHRMEEKYWEYINFIGRVETIQKDSKQLLERIGAWEEIGATGWGVNGTERIFVPTGHEYDGILAAMVAYTPAVDRRLDQIYKDDLENERFAFPNKPTLLSLGTN